MKRVAVASACWGLAWYEPKGRSATTIARRAALVTARTRGTRWSTVTGTVVSKP